ncbi:hypothetical protein GIB67_041421 [Kingdonia uniflora]|uniref:Uncharacterized protein n=1 Tax=Kingdonia uniflora TaxID=39325 RepID=A0A7J7LRF1_9MAGN|nr:hypothetical protein GIB67_041421 [Kingdonia uniflora]
MEETQQEIEVIHSWSAPRSLSTSLMYSFAQRDDMEVLDEPLYANFLQVTGVERPYREELLSKLRFGQEDVGLWKRVIISRFGVIEFGWSSKEFVEAFGCGVWRGVMKFSENYEEDVRMVWIDCAKGMLSVKTFYKALDIPSHNTLLTFSNKKIWILKLPSKATFFAWTSVKELLTNWKTRNLVGLGKVLWHFLPFAVMWAIWLERNARKFEGKEKLKSSVLVSIKAFIFWWSKDSDGNRVVKEVIFGPGKKKYRFCKHIAKQRVPGLTNELMKRGKHFILIRNPLDILPSFDKVVPPSFLELGLSGLVSIYSELCELGPPPPIIDASDLQQDPEAVLSGLCEDLGIPFQAEMLKWEAGPKAVDGIWAPWWYKSVHKSTCFSSAREYPSPLPSSLYDLVEQSLPFYNMLKHNIRRTSSTTLSPSSPPSLPVPANETILVWVGDEIVPRNSAKVSVFDSVVQGGDAVWEGLRVYNGKIFKLDEHLDRLFDSAKSLAFINVPPRKEIKGAIFRTLISNGMFDNAHIRLTLTRGKKVTSGMSPAFNLYGCTLIVLAEWKPPVYDNSGGITLVTATTRRNSPNTQLCAPTLVTSGQQLQGRPFPPFTQTESYPQRPIQLPTQPPQFGAQVGGSSLPPTLHDMFRGTVHLQSVPPPYLTDSQPLPSTGIGHDFTNRPYVDIKDDGFNGHSTGARAERAHDLHLKVLEFDDKSDADDWLDKVEKIFTYKHYGDSKQVAIVETRLSGYALTWWNNVQHSRRSQGYPMITEWSKMRRDMKERIAGSQQIQEWPDEEASGDDSFAACLSFIRDRTVSKNLDSKIHHNNLLNNILAKVEGNLAKADDAIMLDKDGYVSETNATNIFLVKKGRVVTPHADYCLPGVTRSTVMELLESENLYLQERRISLSEFHTADEVVMIDGRVIGNGQVGPVTRRLQNAYKDLTAGLGEAIPTYFKS